MCCEAGPSTPTWENNQMCPPTVGSGQHISTEAHAIRDMVHIDRNKLINMFLFNWQTWFSFLLPSGLVATYWISSWHTLRKPKHKGNPSPSSWEDQISKKPEPYGIILWLRLWSQLAGIQILTLPPTTCDDGEWIACSLYKMGIDIIPLPYRLVGKFEMSQYT